MNTLESWIFKKLLKKKNYSLARTIAALSLKLHKRISEAQFDQYHTLLGTDKVSQGLRVASDRQQRKLLSFDQGNIRNPGKPLKIAVCLSGQPRSLIHCQDSLKRFFHGHEVTYFCHSWQGQTDPELLSSLGKVYFSETESPETFDYERQAIIKYGLKDFNNGVKIPYVSPNVFPMWNGIQQAYLSIQNNNLKAEEFDLICRMRYDNFWIGQFDIEESIFKENQIIIDRNYNGFGGYGDQFAIGPPSAMAKYFNLYTWLTSEFLEGGYSKNCFPEVMLKDYLFHCGIEVIEDDFGLRLLRPEFIGLPVNKIPLRNHAVSKQRNSQLSQYVKLNFPKEWNHS